MAQKISDNILKQVQEQADNGRYGYSACSVEYAMRDTFKDTARFILDEGQSFSFNVYNYKTNGVSHTTVGPGSEVEYLSLDKDWHRFYRIANCDQGYTLTET